MIAMCGNGCLPLAGVGMLLLGTIVWANGASALTLQEAIEQCKTTVGKPIVQPCMQSGGSKDACIAKAAPPVKACVVKAMTAAHGRPNIPLYLRRKATLNLT